MNNQKILEERWKYTDKSLIKFYKEYIKENQNTFDELQDLFNSFSISYQELNKNIPNSLKNRLYREFDKWEKNNKDNEYFMYKISRLKKKNHITYNEYIEIVILGKFYTEDVLLNNAYDELLRSICEYSYNQGLEDINVKKPKIFTSEIYYTIANIPIMEMTIAQYRQLFEQECAEQIYKTTISNIQNQIELSIESKQFKDIQQRQHNKLLDLGKLNNPTGLLANITDVITNMAYLQAGIENKIQECRFIAVEDEKTTKMCGSLDNQIFKINGVNKFKRYSDIDKGIIEIECYGMIQGVNLPPIMNHFHWCRSTITYQLHNYAQQEVIRNYQRDNASVKEYKN